MHPTLSKHLHSDECNLLVVEYEKCNHENKFGRFMGVCSDIQNRMTACFQKELKDRRVQGVKSNHSIDHYIKKDPKLAEKIKILEELRAKKEAESK